MFILPFSSVVGNKVQCLRKKKASDAIRIWWLWNNTEGKRNTNTRRPLYDEKYISHPSFLAASPLAARACSHFTVSKKKNKRLLEVKTLLTPFRWSRSGSWYFQWLLISWLKERNVCTDLLWLCTKRQFSGDQERELETFSRMTNRSTYRRWRFLFIIWLLFFHCSKSNEEADFRKAIQSYENTVGLNCRHTTHRTKRGTKSQTSQVIDMQLHEAVNYVVSDGL